MYSCCSPVRTFRLRIRRELPSRLSNVQRLTIDTSIVVSLIREALSTANVNDATYSITRLPPNATWGVGYQDKYLTTGSRQCKVRFAAKLENVSFFDRQGRWLDRIRVGFNFITAAEEGAMRAFFGRWGCTSKHCVHSSCIETG